MKTEFYVEFNGEKTDYRNLVELAKEAWKADDFLVKDIETMNLYFKPEERVCYCVVNGEHKYSFQI